MKDETISTGIPALMISAASAVNGRSGGVQICAREYLTVLKAAGFTITILPFEGDQRLKTRLKRRLQRKPYFNYLPPSLVNQAVSTIEETKADYIFLYGVDVAPLAIPLREHLGKSCKIILLSYGLASVDYLHTMRANGQGDFSEVNGSDYKILAQQLVAECEHRRYLDHVFCLAPFEAEIERWLGTINATWIPRTITNRALDWQPMSSRVGFVGTIDHPPNAEGLILYLEELKKIVPQGVKLRLVGGPPKAAESIARRFPFVEYLGALSDDELEIEARTWNCFVHPIFCYARGCSTKLAVALGWQIPVVTTSAGCRGYAWHDGNLPISETPKGLAELSLTMLERDTAEAARQEVIKIVQSSPTISAVASKVQLSLSLPCSEVEDDVCQ